MATDTFADVLAANERYAERFDLAHLPVGVARKLAVVTCMDSRLDPLRMLGLEPGDAKVLRNAGGRVRDDVVEDVALAQRALGVERVMVIEHTDCRAGIDDQRAAIRADVEKLSARVGGITVGGFLYDVATGRLTQIC